MKNKNKSWFFFRFVVKPNYIDLLDNFSLGESKIREQSKKLGMSYQHLTNVIRAAEQEKIITRKKIDGKYEIHLTKKGEVLAKLSRAIKWVVIDWKGDETIQMLDNQKFKPKEE